MKISAKQFFYIMIILTVSSFGSIIAAFYWGEKILQSKAATLSELQTDVDISQEKIIKLNQVAKSQELADEANETLKTLLPATKEQERLIADVIYTASSEAGIPLAKIGSIAFTNSEEPSDLSGTEESEDFAGVYMYPFTISVTEISFETLLKLLQEIETNGRLVQVDTLQISPDKKLPGQISSVNLSLKAFLKPE